MNKEKTLLGKIASAYKKEGWNGISRRITMRTNHLKRLGLTGILDSLKGKIISIKDGKYSLKYAYPERFFADNLEDSRPMAEYLAPRIVKDLQIKSVIDLGCATGHWVNALDKAGADVLGIEGGEKAKTMLVCDPTKVIFADLREPLNIDRKFDLALSIEVAEHIEHKFVNEYVGNMTRFSPKLIMITAATPGQGGEFHVNEQEAEYWDEIFLKSGFKRVPSIEKRIARLVEDAKNEENPPEIMKNPSVEHTGVYVPFWMPRNLLAYSSNPSQFDYLEK